MLRDGRLDRVGERLVCLDGRCLDAVHARNGALARVLQSRDAVVVVRRELDVVREPLVGCLLCSMQLVILTFKRECCSREFIVVLLLCVLDLRGQCLVRGLQLPCCL